MDDATRVEVEAAAFRALRRHLMEERTDVQNIDLMELAGFCRNCLARWMQEAAAERGVTMDKAEARAALGLSLDEQVVAFVGRIQPLKAPDVLLRAAAKLPDVRVVVAGGPSGSGLAVPDGLVSLADELGITDRVTFFVTETGAQCGVEVFNGCLRLDPITTVMVDADVVVVLVEIVFVLDVADDLL